MNKLLLIPIVVALLIVGCKEKSFNSSISTLEAFSDSLIQKSVDREEVAGVSVLVHQKGKTLLRKSYGYASLELSVPLPLNGGFEIGSVTKQFTAAAILKLIQANRLSMDDDFTQYIKYDAQGRRITIRHLLNHTSGMADYTELEGFEELMVQKLPKDTVVRITESNPSMFEPGEAMIYNNSAYFILGLIIEKVTGQTYAQYLEETFFKPLGMQNTSYCSTSDIVNNKVYGYRYTPKGLKQKGYIDHTWPYAAGSLCSTTEDLLIWMTALHKGKVLSENLYQSMITPEPLLDGNLTYYAKGLVNYLDYGHRKIGHQGGINGFLSDTRYYPKEDLYVICLANTIGPKRPNLFADQLTWNLLEKQEPQSLELDIDTKELEGIYKGAIRGIYQHSIEVKSTIAGLTIKSALNEKPATLDVYIGNNTWSVDNDPWSDGNNKITINNEEYRHLSPYGFYILKKEDK